MCTENKLKELLTFSFKPANADHKNSDHKTKRIWVQTEKIKESKEQADICSPKKKKRKAVVPVAIMKVQKKSKEKKRKDESAAARKTERKKSGNSSSMY